MAAPLYYTPDMVRAVPDDGRRYETVHGELLVTPSPRYRHQLIVSRLLAALIKYCDRTQLGTVLTSPADVTLTDDSLVQPDVFVVPTPAERDPGWADLARPILIAEILSPSTARYDRFTKRVHYQRAGVPTYWLLDAVNSEIEIWTPEAVQPVIARDGVEWRPDGPVEGFSLELDRLFR